MIILCLFILISIVLGVFWGMFNVLISVSDETANTVTMEYEIKIDRIIKNFSKKSNPEYPSVLNLLLLESEINRNQLNLNDLQKPYKE